MTGFPPPPAQRWQLATWQEAPTNRWSFSHLREVVPTARVGRGSGPVLPLPPGPAVDLDVGFVRADGTATSPAAVLAAGHTDGFALMSAGQLVCELYPELTGPDDTHLLMSVSKSLVGCVAGILVGRGLLDPDAPITGYLPELTGAGYGGATVRHLLDMRSGAAFSEAYLDPNAEVRRLEQVIGWAPRTEPTLPTSMYDFLGTLVADRPHGGAFSYRSCETDVLGWVCEQASGVRMPELMSETLWSRLGAEHDLDAAVDPAGAVFHDGGLAATLRDLARFGLMLARGGRVGSDQVVPQSWLDDAGAGGVDSRAAFAASDAETWMPGGIYRNQFWVPYQDRAVLIGLGIHGQLVWVDRDRDLVAVKLSSWPLPQAASVLLDTWRAIEVLAAQVTSG